MAELTADLILNTKILVRRAEFDDACVLAQGEPGYHTTTHEFKIGDGQTTWKDLPFANEAQIEAILDGYKTVQEEKSFSGATTKTVTGVTQNANGEINVTYDDIAFPAETDISIVRDTEAEVPTTATVDVYKNIDANGHVITEEKVQVATAKAIADALQAAKDYADANDANDNTAHSHVNGLGTVATGGGISGEAKIDLNLEFAELGEDKKLKLVDKTSKTVVAEFEASEFIKDGMLHDVEYDADTNKLTFTWNTDAGTKTDEVVLSDIIDPYVFEAGAKLDVVVDGTKVTYAHETVAAPTETAGSGRKYLTGVTTDGYGHITGFTTATEVDQDLTHDHDGQYKVIQTPVVDPTAAGKSLEFIDTISQDAQGKITATKKTVNLEDYYTKEEADAADDNTTYTVEATETPLQFTVTPSEGAVQTVTLVAPDVGVTKVVAGTDIVVTPTDGKGEVTVAHKAYTTGTVMDAAHNTKTDPSFITGISIENGHVTGATVQNLKEVLKSMTIVLDGGTLKIG